MNVRPRMLWLALVAYILGSSVMGLASAMATGGSKIFSIVWGASLLGDVLFTLGMGAVGIGAYHLAERRRWPASALLGFLGTWFVYTLSWSVTAPAINAKNNAGFASPGAPSWVFTFQWGWPGLVYSCAFPLLLALTLLGKSSGASATPAPAFEAPSGGPPE